LFTFVPVVVMKLLVMKHLAMRLCLMRLPFSRIRLCVLLCAFVGLVGFFLTSSIHAAFAQTPYKLPPKPVVDVIDAPVTPAAIPSPRGNALLLVEVRPNPSIAVLAEPVLKLAGIRLSPALTAQQRTSELKSLTIQRIGTTAADKQTIRIQTPDGARLGTPIWSHDGTKIAFTRDVADGVELWTADAATGKARAVKNVRVTDILSAPFEWMADSKRLLVKLVPPQRGKAPEPPRVPTGPVVEETAGKQAQVRTYQDLLKNPSDEVLFEYYATSQLAVVNTTDDKITLLGAPTLVAEARVSPDEKYLLVTRLQKPFSYRVTADEFAKSLEIWDMAGGKMLKQLANLPVEDETPRQGVPMGIRNIVWQALHPAKLLWVEALDGGDPMKKVDFRDKMMTLTAPFTATPQELCKVKHRFVGYGWTAQKDSIFITEFDRDRRWRTTYLTNLATQPAQQTTLFDLSINDSYNDPGQPLYERRKDGERVMVQDGDFIYLTGAGASEQGDRPFLDKFNLKTLEKTRLYRSGETSYETVVGFASEQQGSPRSRIITRYETKTDVPNFFTVNLADGNKRTAITEFKDPTPQLTSLKKELVKYKRADGVPLSGTLYLPPDYKPGTRLPLIVWAYPLEYNDAATAGQVRSSPNRFTTRSRSYSTIYFALQGYAVLQDATMPVVGSPETANNTFIEQITAGAKAAIDYLDSLGIADRKRVGVAGHSYGAFMTANLLAHTDLFAAGLAGSGAYNRTLTPFGFQGERRSYWEAADIYTKLSPFTYANNIKKPLLMLHGEADNNPGTFPIQSQRLYAAISGNGGTARLVMLPYESHGYLGRESVLHVMAEMLDWADKYIKNQPAK
jgi:dipeptidyl aminopeptidase/acylaminoacyl peptidase